MKILMVTMSMNIGGAETHILELCRELKNNGHEITLASFGGVYAEEAVACGIRHVCLPLHSKRPDAVLHSYRELKKLILAECFDIVHAHARIPAFIVGLLHDSVTYDDGRKFRFVTTAHLNFTTNALLRKISRWGERVMAVSDDITDYLVEEYGFPRDKIHVTINGIDTKKFAAETDFSSVLEQHSLKKENRRIVYMSRMDADRADPAYRLIRIAPRLAERYPDTDLILVGGGNVFDEIRSLAGEANRAIGRNYVTVTGAVSNTNEYCAAATVFVGVSRSALEAMAAEKPVIIAGNQGSLGIFDQSKIKAAVDTNFCCRGFDVADEGTLFADLCALLDQSGDALAAIGRFNRDFILDHYTAHRMAKDYLAMYEATLKMPVPVNPNKVSPDLVMSGYYGFGNLGDESLLDIITSSLAEEIPDVKIVALTKNPKAESRRTGLGCVSRFDLFKLNRLFGRAKMLISGGGSLLQDKTSKRSLSYYVGVMSLAERKGAKLAVLANGIGPISYPENIKKTVKMIEKTGFVSVRDAESKAELANMGCDVSKLLVSADPAFLIEPASEHNLERVLAKHNLSGRRYFAVSVRPLNRRKGGDDTISDESAYVAVEVAAASVDIAKRYGLVPVVIPMQKTQDEKLCRVLCDSLHMAGVDAVMMLPESARELIGVLGGAEFVIGMRLHAIIFASSAGCPVIGLSYDPKVKSMMAELGQKYLIDLENGFDHSLDDTLIAYADELMKNRDAIAANLAKVADGMREKARNDMREIHRYLDAAKK